MFPEYQEPKILPPGPLCQPTASASHSRWHASPHGLWNQQISQAPGSGALDSLASRVGWGETENYPFSLQGLPADKLTGDKMSPHLQDHLAALCLGPRREEGSRWAWPDCQMTLARVSKFFLP